MKFIVELLLGIFAWIFIYIQISIGALGDFFQRMEGGNGVILPSSLTGFLIRGVGSAEILRWNLVTSRVEIIYKDYENKKAYYGNAIKVKGNRFLVSGGSIDKDSVMEFTIENGKIITKTLIEGASAAHYSKETNKLFICKKDIANISYALYVMNYGEDMDKAKKITEGCDTLQISPDQIAIYHEKNNNATLSIYNITSDKLTELDLNISGCTMPLLWRSKTKQIICEEKGEKQEIVLFGLDGTKEEKMLLSSSTINEPLIMYLPDTDQLLFNKFVNNYRNLDSGGADIWVYDFAKHKARFFRKGGMDMYYSAYYTADEAEEISKLPSLGSY